MFCVYFRKQRAKKKVTFQNILPFTEGWDQYGLETKQKLLTESRNSDCTYSLSNIQELSGDRVEEVSEKTGAITASFY